MNSKLLIGVLSMAVTTYLIRMLPLNFMRKEITNKYVKSFFYYIPFGVLAAMTFPDILYSTDSLISALFGLGVAILLSVMKKSMITVALSACLAVYICEILF